MKNESVADIIVTYVYLINILESAIYTLAFPFDLRCERVFIYTNKHLNIHIRTNIHLQLHSIHIYICER